MDAAVVAVLSELDGTFAEEQRVAPKAFWFLLYCQLALVRGLLNTAGHLDSPWGSDRCGMSHLTPKGSFELLLTG